MMAHGHLYRSTTIWLLVVFFFIVFRSEAAQNNVVPAMFVFGDSLVDVGNNNYLKTSLSKANFPHNGVDYPHRKPTGRFSNGKNAADFLADHLRLTSSPPPYLALKSKPSNTNAFIAGVNFASGGAGILNGTATDTKQSILLGEQVEYYSAVQAGIAQLVGSPTAAQRLLSNSLFAVVVGNNDIFGYFGSSSSSSALRKQSTPQQYVAAMTLSLKAYLHRLYELGGRKFMVAGVGKLGCCPGLRVKTKTKGCNEEVNNWSLKYNEGLQAMMQLLKSELQGFSYSYFDTYRIVQDSINTPAAFGFTEVKAACCGLGALRAVVPCLPVAVYCPNRTDHLFWDFYHPTEASSRIFVQKMFDGPEQYVYPVNVRQLLGL